MLVFVLVLGERRRGKRWEAKKGGGEKTRGGEKKKEIKTVAKSPGLGSVKKDLL